MHHDFFSWELVKWMDVHLVATVAGIGADLVAASHRPSVEVQRSWYFG